MDRPLIIKIQMHDELHLIMDKKILYLIRYLNAIQFHFSIFSSWFGFFLKTRSEAIHVLKVL